MLHEIVLVNQINFFLTSWVWRTEIKRLIGRKQSENNIVFQTSGSQFRFSHRRKRQPTSWVLKTDRCRSPFSWTPSPSCLLMCSKKKNVPCRSALKSRLHRCTHKSMCPGLWRLAAPVGCALKKSVLLSRYQSLPLATSLSLSLSVFQPLSLCLDLVLFLTFLKFCDINMYNIASPYIITTGASLTQSDNPHWLPHNPPPPFWGPGLGYNDTHTMRSTRRNRWTSLFPFSPPLN
jgi:hypothetical protein